MTTKASVFQTDNGSAYVRDATEREMLFDACKMAIADYESNMATLSDPYPIEEPMDCCLTVKTLTAAREAVAAEIDRRDRITQEGELSLEAHLAATLCPCHRAVREYHNMRTAILDLLHELTHFAKLCPGVAEKAKAALRAPLAATAAEVQHEHTNPFYHCEFCGRVICQTCDSTVDEGNICKECAAAYERRCAMEDDCQTQSERTDP